jgi:hypothetical protein
MVLMKELYPFWVCVFQFDYGVWILGLISLLPFCLLTKKIEVNSLNFVVQVWALFSWAQIGLRQIEQIRGYFGASACVVWYCSTLFCCPSNASLTYWALCL